MKNKITIIGSGFMGKQIAASFANAGLAVCLVKYGKASEEDMAQIQTTCQKLIHHKEDNGALSVISYQDYRQEGQDSGLVIESIIEDLGAKKALLADLSQFIGPEVILASNTSSLSIQALSADLDASVQERFLGLHFFAPVTSNPLVEIVPHSDFPKDKLQKLCQWLSDRVGKKYIIAQDVTGFVANRIAFYSNYDIMYRAETEDWLPSQTDALSGKYLGRTKMGPYRLVDYTGLDLFEQALANYQEDPTCQDFFPPRSAHRPLLEAGYYGDKVGQGYYKKDQGKRYHYNFQMQAYEATSFPRFDIMDDLDQLDTRDRFQAILDVEDPYGQFMAQSLVNLLAFAAQNVGIACQDYRDIDRAMVWGYQWTYGPFQIWDLIGFDRVKDLLAKRQDTLPDWLENFQGPFYPDSHCLARHQSLAAYDKDLILDLGADYRLYQGPNQTLVFSLEAKNSVINLDLLKGLDQALDRLEDSPAIGLVIYSPQEHFSRGYDVKAFEASIAQDRVVEDCQISFDLGHRIIQRMKYSQKPIAVACRGYCLGGGAELALHSSRIFVSPQVKMGLPEANLGLIPGAGGLVELAERIYTADMTRMERKNRLLACFETVAYGKISAHAKEARELGYLTKEDVVVPNEDYPLEAAIDWLTYQGRYQSFRPQFPQSYPVLGKEFMALVMGTTQNWRQGLFISDHDKSLADAIGQVLAGGELAMEIQVSREDLLEVEKTVFTQLLTSQKTQDRIQHFVKHKTILRN
ncbi:3-hydroxyacyl-CoA dehydrogenase/enoyl-CoA hydratase family protein [Aerococcus sanguinicola]|uniref:3-hydroxyacyl-CoA dehydrogenase/enoyl-CoA hydratase family protein n=1 Tax=Aerococcus sanguinicola TaxID=119206 RepID=UPI0018A752C0|nr:3-hydroxyacyl-CoA dehydrogenase/enoyl-CoA hydratase family protein [Aerococcus sanguinicola]